MLRVQDLHVYYGAIHAVKGVFWRSPTARS